MIKQYITAYLIILSSLSLYAKTEDDNIVTTEINIDIPSGYKINQQSLSALDKSVKNEAGEFSVVASADDDKLKIMINKKYLKPRLDASLWPDMLKILDSAAAWNSATVVLEKK